MIMSATITKNENFSVPEDAIEFFPSQDTIYTK